MPNKQQHQALKLCVTLHLSQFVSPVHLSQWHGYAVHTCHHDVASSEEALKTLRGPILEHAPSEKVVGHAANSRRHVPDDDSDHGASHNRKEAGSVIGKQGKHKRGAAAESSSAGCRSPRGKKASLSLSSVFRISAIVPLLRQQWQEQKEGQHMLPDL